MTNLCLNQDDIHHCVQFLKIRNNRITSIFRPPNFIIKFTKYKCKYNPKCNQYKQAKPKIKIEKRNQTIKDKS